MGRLHANANATAPASTKMSAVSYTHLDVYKRQIMVQPDGNVKVMDFGIARAKNSVMTQTSSVLGTAHYLSLIHIFSEGDRITIGMTNFMFTQA